MLECSLLHHRGPSVRFFRAVSILTPGRPRGHCKAAYDSETETTGQATGLAVAMGLAVADVEAMVGSALGTLLRFCSREVSTAFLERVVLWVDKAGGEVSVMMDI